MSMVLQFVRPVEVSHGGGAALQPRGGGVHVLARLLAARPDHVHVVVHYRVVGGLFSLEY